MRDHLFKDVKASEKVEVYTYLKSVYKNKIKSKSKILLRCIKLSKSTLNETINRIPSKTEATRSEAMKLILKIFLEYKEIYGAPKIHAEIVKLKGTNYITIRTVSVYMKRMNLRAITVSKHKVARTDTAVQLGFMLPKVNYIKEDRPVTPRTHLLTDITYIYTKYDGWVYLLTYMDLFTRKIISWDVNETMDAKWVTNLAIEAIEQCPNLLYIHSDRGSQYTSECYVKSLLTRGISPSFSAKGYPYHNAWIESFHAQIKKEWIYRRVIRNYMECKEICFQYIEGFYNTIRTQKALNYTSPDSFEKIAV